MNRVVGALTVLFQEPFWVGVFEQQCGEAYGAVRVVFGSEPTDPEVYAFISENYCKLQFAQTTAEQRIEKSRVNPKRLQREARRATETRGISAKAHEAMRIELETRAKVRVAKSRADREAEERLMFEKHQLKLKKKRRGH